MKPPISALAVLAAVAALVATSACAPVTRVPTPIGARSGVGGEAPATDVPDLQQRALLLLMVDQQRFEPITVDSAMKGDAGLREELAVALGRVGDPRAVSYLGELLADEAPAVRRAAAFALGELDVERSDAERAARRLLVAVAEPDRETGTLAVEALGKLGVAVAEVVGVLTRSELGEEERWARLLPPLFRFDEAATVALADGALDLLPGLDLETDLAGELHRRAAYALARNPRPEALPRLRELLTDDDPRVRGWAARAVGLVGTPLDLPRLAPLLDAEDPAPVVQALRAAAALAGRAAGTPPAPEGWHARLVELLDDPRPHVRLEVLDRAASWLPPPGGPAPDVGATALAAALRARLDAPPGSHPAAERAAALLALASGPRGAGTAAPPGGPAPAERVSRAAAGEPLLRAAAARATGHLPAATAREMLTALAADADPAVRTAAVETLLALLAPAEAGPEEAGGEAATGAGDGTADATPAGAPPAPWREAAGVASGFLEAPDAGVRTVTFAWLAEHPVLPYAEVTRAVQGVLGRNVEAQLEAVRALVARAEAVAEERGGVVTVLERLAARAPWVVARAAADALVGLDRPAPPTGHPNADRPPGVYQEILRRTARPRTVVLETDAGTLRLRLDCPRAPLTCLNFVQLAEQGFYDGVPFHRVVPDFVVQGGDPRGDGLGGPGYTVRDEVHRLRYGRGVVGMALAGPHTGGSQFFVTLSPQPHLDGGYTAFGEVVAGHDVLDRVTRGTAVRRARVEEE